MELLPLSACVCIVFFLACNCLVVAAGIRQGLDVVGVFGPLAGLVSMSVDAHEAFLELFSVESDL